MAGSMMRPKERRESGQNDLFRSRLDQILNLDHALVKLARSIDWSFLEQRFGARWGWFLGAARPPSYSVHAAPAAGRPPAVDYSQLPEGG